MYQSMAGEPPSSDPKYKGAGIEPGQSVEFLTPNNKNSASRNPA